jgi:hypothetical protein
MVRENIDNLSDKAWKELAIQLSSISYIERIKILYDRFNIICGNEKRIIGKKEFVISATPGSPEENLQRWEYYVEQEGMKFSQIWIHKRLKNLEKTPDKTKAIQKFLVEIKSEIDIDIRVRRGYDYAESRIEMEFVNNGPLTTNHTHIFKEWIMGFGLYYADLEFQNMQREVVEETVEALIPKMDILTDRQRIALAEVLGLITFLRSDNWFTNKKSNLSNVLCLLFGINLQSERAENIKKDITKMDAADPGKSPINTKNIEAVYNQLSAIGFNVEDLRKLKK